MEKYKPTQEDKARISPKKDMLKVSGDGVFATLQGEGKTAGFPSVFLRLHYCNLSCGQKGGWQCDTDYTWDKNKAEYWKEPGDWSFQESADKIEAEWSRNFGYLESKRLVVTGGEPLLQQEKIIKLISKLPGWKVEIETNGTIDPLPELSECQFNCSPKLENSGNTKRLRYKPEILRHINKIPESNFKFVASSPEDFEEIDNIVTECRLDPNKILIMPEGKTFENVELHAQLIKEEIAKRNWKLTYRNQLIWFGPKRRT